MRAADTRGSGGWWIFAEQQMSAIVVAVVKEATQPPPQVLFVEYDNVVEQLDPRFRSSSVPRRNDGAGRRRSEATVAGDEVGGHTVRVVGGSLPSDK